MFNLPENYHRNTVISNDSGSHGGYWDTGAIDLYQLPAYRWIRNYVNSSTPKIKSVIEIGCGNGRKTIAFFSDLEIGAIGIDQKSGISHALKNDKRKSIAWVESDIESDKIWQNTIKNAEPGLIVSLDVIEHLQNPTLFLEMLREASHGWEIAISTPNRDLLDFNNPIGPPSNLLHAQEWSKSEFLILLEGVGFKVTQQIDLLPRDFKIFNLKEIKRYLLRIIKGKKNPDQKSCQLWIIS
jgi:2-polyprenyl-3-methyl-5-hydroxy-6-metoxy-1,4-benzoquinol methylase